MIGTTLGSYEVIEKLGAGGMGEVYRGRDTDLGRDVALKVLPADLEADPDRLARFEQEARTLASLNHPNIAQVFGLERADAPVIVMELVEGEDLSQKLSRGRLAMDDALDIARQVADALAAAHDAGVVHRDLKPGNIQVRDDGAVKVLDFGLAKAGGVGQTSGDQTESPTLMSPAMTASGMILGTAAYMAPEQAKGKVVDRRADLWAFGCVLYEMLTGSRPFAGDDVADMMASVLKDEVDFDALPTDTPSSVRRLLERSLRKDPAQRLDSAAAARLEIVEASNGGSEVAVAAGDAPALSGARFAWLAAGLIVGALVVYAALVGLGDVTPPTRVVAIPHDGDISDGRISPTGEYVIMTREPAGMYLRHLESGDVTVIAEDSLSSHTWSPDGTQIAYASGDGIWVYTLATGDRVRVDDRPQGPSNGMHWGDDGRIVGSFWSPSTGAGLYAFYPDRPGARELILPDVFQDASWVTPHVLPGGKGIIYSEFDRATRGIAGRLMVYDGTEQRLLFEEGGGAIEHAIYSSTGHLIYRRGGDSPGTFARPFDIGTFEIGAPVRLSDVDASPSVADDGSLLLGWTGPNWAEQFAVASVIRADGRSVPIGQPEQGARWMSLSPEGNRVALASSLYGVIVQDFRLGTSINVIGLDGFGLGRTPFWRPDGDVLGFPITAEDDSRAIVFVDARGGGMVGTTLEDAYHGSFTHDAEGVVFIRDGRIFVGGPFGQAPAPFPSDAENVDNLALSHSGDFLVYQVGSGNDATVFVERFPEGGSRIAVGPGFRPRFGANDERLFFALNRLRGALVSVQAVDFDASTGTLSAEPEEQVVIEILAASRNWGLLPDDSVVVLRSAASRAPNMVLIDNWQRLLEPNR